MLNHDQMEGVECAVMHSSHLCDIQQHQQRTKDHNQLNGKHQIEHLHSNCNPMT